MSIIRLDKDNWLSLQNRLDTDIDNKYSVDLRQDNRQYMEFIYKYWSIEEEEEEKDYF